MLNWNEKRQFKKDLTDAMNEIPVPDSLIDFAKQVPYRSPDVQPITVVPKKKRVFPKIAAACVIAISVSIGAAQLSPAFAQFFKGIPGFSIAASWLDEIRGYDGVNHAQSNGYTPIPPVVQQKGDLTVSISDIYLTSDKLTFKTFIKSDDIKQNVFKREDGLLDINWRKANRYRVDPLDFDHSDGSGSGGTIESNDETKEPVVVQTNTFQVGREKVDKFLRNNPRELRFELTIWNPNSGGTLDKIILTTPFDKSKLLEDRIIPLQQKVEVAQDDPDIREFTFDHIIITPTNTFIDVNIAKDANYYVNFMHFGQDTAKLSPYLTDDKGNRYPLHLDEPKNYLQPNPDYYRRGDGNLLTFTASPYFEQQVDKLYMHINSIHITEKTPSSTFTVSPGEKLPKTIQFKNKQFTVIDAQYQEGYLHLKIKKDQPEAEVLEGIAFYIPSYHEIVSKSEELKQFYDNHNIEGTGRAAAKDKDADYYDLYIIAPKQDSYEISLLRNFDMIPINKDIPINLK